MDTILSSRIMTKTGQYILALVFLVESLSYLIFPEKYIIFTPGWLPAPFFWVMLIGFIWFLTATSFIINTWTYITGSLIAILMIGLSIYSGSTGFDSPATSVPTILKIAFYIALSGGALIVAAHGRTFVEPHNGLYIIGRILVGLFFMTVGYLHLTHISEDASLIYSMPFAKYLVIFTGFCWIATGLSFWANMAARLAALLASLLVLIIILTINIPTFSSLHLIDSILSLTKNIGIIGCCLLVGAKGKYWFNLKN